MVKTYLNYHRFLLGVSSLLIVLALLFFTILPPDFIPDALSKVNLDLVSLDHTNLRTISFKLSKHYHMF